MKTVRNRMNEVDDRQDQYKLSDAPGPVVLVDKVVAAQNPACNSCGSRDSSVRTKRGNIRYRTCSRCGTIFRTCEING